MEENGDGGDAMMLSTPGASGGGGGGSNMGRRRPRPAGLCPSSAAEPEQGAGGGGGASLMMAGGAYDLLARKRQMLLDARALPPTAAPLPPLVHPAACNPGGFSPWGGEGGGGGGGSHHDHHHHAAAPLQPAACASGGPFGRASSPFCAAAELAAAAAALSMEGSSGGSPDENETSWSAYPLVPGTGGAAGALLAVRCDWVPGLGSGKVHVVAPPLPLPLPSARAAGEAAALEEAARVAHSFLRLWGPRAWAHALTGKDVVVRFEERRRGGGAGGAGMLPPMPAAAGPSSLSGLGAGMLLSLLQLVAGSVGSGGQQKQGRPPQPMRWRARVALLGEATLEGRLVLAAWDSLRDDGDRQHRGNGQGPQQQQQQQLRQRQQQALAARVQAALASGAVDCVILPRDGEAGWRRLSSSSSSSSSSSLPSALASAVRFAGDVRELFSLVAAAGAGGSEAACAWLPPRRPEAGGEGGSSTNNSSRVCRLFVAPTVLPADDGVVAVAARSVEACALPRPLGGAGRFFITGLPSEGGGGGGGGGGSCSSGSSKGGAGGASSARAALNTARFLLLKHQGDIARPLGPPAIDLRAMRLVGLTPAAAAAAAAAADPAGACGGSGMDEEREVDAAAGAGAGAVDIHLHLPQALPSPAYALPALLALVAVAWPGARESLDGIASLGEVNALGALGLHARLRPTFVAALNECGVRKMVLPRGPALELVREEGGGVGDRWLLQSGVMVQGVERVLDVVRACFLGDDGL